MPKELIKEKYWKIFQKLPKELKEQMLYEETADNIFNVCDRNNIEEIPVVSSCVGDVLIGILPPDSFQEAIEEKLELSKEVAKKVAQEIYRFIFYPVKADLEKLYRMEIAPFAKMPVTPPPSERPPAPSAKEDVYREPIEGGEKDV